MKQIVSTVVDQYSDRWRALVEATRTSLLSNAADALSRFMETCQNCKDKDAEIYQDNGDYCLNCWQDITHT